MAKKINYKRRRIWSLRIHTLYKTWTKLLIGALLLIGFVVLFMYFNNQSRLLEPAQQQLTQKGKTSMENYNFAQYSTVSSSISGNATMVATALSIMLVIVSLINQTSSTRKNGFKQNFFEFLKLHRSNVDQISTKGKKGHDAFIAMYQELIEIIPVVENEKLSLAAKQVSGIAYLAFFWGLGPNASPILIDSLKNNYSLTDDQISGLIKKLEAHKQQRDDQIAAEKSTEGKGNLYCILDGHQSDLGHYYRHLYQTVTFINNESALWYFEKYYYGKTLRAQFSNHELAIFLYNANSPLGRNWEPERTSTGKKLISAYELVKNVPLSLVTRLNIRETYPSISFEYDEL
jgi:hypothetical protein